MYNNNYYVRDAARNQEAPVVMMVAPDRVAMIEGPTQRLDTGGSPGNNVSCSFFGPAQSNARPPFASCSNVASAFPVTLPCFSESGCDEVRPEWS